MTNANTKLEGGRSGISTDGNHVYRPKPFNATDIHRFLDYLQDSGITPTVIGVKGEQEILSFMQGEVYNELPKHLQTPEMIQSAGRLLKKFHDKSRAYLTHLQGNEAWLLPPQEPVELLCHGDYAPYNVTVVAGKAHGIIDFDTLHPAFAMWDIAYGIYRWVPFEAGGDLTSQMEKAKLFLNAYGSHDKDFVSVLIRRLQALVDFMQHEAQSGNDHFKQNIADGHLQKYLNDIDYLKEHQIEIENYLK